jgi:phosphoribosyl 1,2-cyclic phosphodiesterase
LDCSWLDYEGSAHLSYKKVCKVIDQKLRHRVVLMHLDENFNTPKAIADGFKIAGV